MSNKSKHIDAPIIKCAYKDCTKLITNEYGQPGVSISRFDNNTLICSHCGAREAFNAVLESMLVKTS